MKEKLETKKEIKCVSNQLISLTSRESDPRATGTHRKIVSNQLISLTSREV